MSPETATEPGKGPDDIAPSERDKNTVYVLFRQTDALENIIGVYSNPDAVWHALLNEVPKQNLALSLADIESMIPDENSVIASKHENPEIRISLQPVLDQSLLAT